MGEFYFITGPMFSGKTEELIRLARREEVGGRKIIYIKPLIDQRYSLNEISSHNNNKIRAEPISSTLELFNKLKEYKKQNKKYDLLAIDEIQFFDDKIVSLIKALKYETLTTIIASGLSLDFRGEPFKFKNSEKNIGELMVYATNIYTLSAICTFKNENGEICRKPAYYTQRIINGSPAEYNSPIVMIGGKEKYEARCKEHHIVPKRPIIGLEKMLG